eukprot:g2649.t1
MSPVTKIVSLLNVKLVWAANIVRDTDSLIATMLSSYATLMTLGDSNSLVRTAVTSPLRKVFLMYWVSRSTLFSARYLFDVFLSISLSLRLGQNLGVTLKLISAPLWTLASTSGKIQTKIFKHSFLAVAKG